MMDGKEETVNDCKMRLEKGFNHGFIDVDIDVLKAEVALVKFMLKEEGRTGELLLFEEGSRKCPLL